jgi:mycothiol synthase
MTITCRQYTDNDLPHLQAALAGWIQEAGDCGYCHVGELVDQIYKELHGKLPRHELVQIWEDESGIIGIATYLFDNAFAVYTSPSYRGTAHEIEMLQAATKTTRQSMQKMGSTETSVIMDVWDCDETRKKLLRHLGFEEYKLWGYYQERSLSVPIPESKLPDNFTIRTCTLDDIERYIVAYNSAFNASWSPDDYREAVMKKVGYDPQHIIVAVAPDGQFAAFTMIWFDDLNKVGLFEPVGTHRDFHRQGLGRALMLHCLHQMKARGMETAKVGHDAENLAAQSLYQSIGFTQKYTSLGFKKE